MGGAEEFSGSGVFNDDDKACVASPCEHARDGAGGTITHRTESLGSDGGDQSGGPVHRMDEAAQDTQPAGAFVGAPALGVNEVFHDAEGLDLVGEHSPSGVDEVPPAGVWLEAASGKAGGGAAAAMSQSTVCRPVQCWAASPRDRWWPSCGPPGAAPRGPGASWRLRSYRRRASSGLLVAAAMESAFGLGGIYGEGKCASLVARQAPANTKLWRVGTVSVSH